MFQSLFSKIALSLVALASFFGYHAPVANVGALNPVTPAVFETYVATQQGTSDTTLTLASGSLRDGTTLTGYVCLTIDTNTTSLEYECGTAAGTSITGLSRGLDATTGTTTVTSLKFAHRIGADVKVTDFPTLTIVNNQLNGTQNIPAPINYASTVTNAQISASNTNLVNVSLLNATAISGAPNSSETENGISQLSTSAQAGAGTSLGSTAARLVLPASLATSTSQVAQSSVVVTKSTGKIDPTFLNGTSETYTFNASTTLAATTTINGSSLTTSPLIINTTKYAFPSSQGSASTTLTNDGSGNLSWSLPEWSIIATSTLTGAVSTTTLPIPYRSQYQIVVEPRAVSSGSGSTFIYAQFNSDTAANYGYSVEEVSSSATFVSLATQKVIRLNGANGIGNTFGGLFNLNVANQSGFIKLVTWTGYGSPNAAPNAPSSQLGSANWNNTSTPINSISIGAGSTSGAETLGVGTRITVYGSNK